MTDPEAAIAPDRRRKPFHKSAAAPILAVVLAAGVTSYFVNGSEEAENKKLLSTVPDCARFSDEATGFLPTTQRQLEIAPELGQQVCKMGDYRYLVITLPESGR